MPTRRTMELIIVTVALMQPVLAAGKTWARKHLVTSSNPATSMAAEVAEAVL